MDRWRGKETCDFCGRSVREKDHRAFVDGKTIHGPWALMCIECYPDHGVGLGVGKGQSYDTVTFEKLA